MITIRSASPDDLLILADIENDAAQAIPIDMLPADGQLRVPEHYVHKKINHILLAQPAKEPVGFAALQEKDGQAYLYELSVRTGYARQGIGRQLLNASADWARAQNYAALILTTCPDLPFNGPFYERYGFKMFEPDARGWPQLTEDLHWQRSYFDGKQRRVAMILKL